MVRISVRTKLIGHKSEQTGFWNVSPVSRSVNVNRITLIKSVQFILVEILFIKSILFEIRDGMEGRFVVQCHADVVVTFEIVNRIADDFRRMIAQHLKGFAQSIGTDDGSFVGFVRPLHPSHKEFQQFVTSIEGHESVLDGRLT